MPAFLSHFACGATVLRSSDDSFLKQCILRHPGVYGTALAGPDLFFYSLGEMIRPGHNIGHIIHTKRTGRFLAALYQESMSMQGEDREIALTYFAGFVGHYCLDASCHPLVYHLCGHDTTKKGDGKHYRFEAAMDNLCCETYLKRNINDSHQIGLIRCRMKEIRVIARILSAAAASVFPDEKAAVFRFNNIRFRLILIEYRIISSLLIDPSGFQEAFFVFLEKHTLGYTYMSALCINRNTYHVTEKEKNAFLRCFERGRDTYRRLMPYLAAAAADPDQAQVMISKIGSRSYHTGKDCSTIE